MKWGNTTARETTALQQNKNLICCLVDSLYICQVSGLLINHVKVILDLICMHYNLR